jgi:hypothetical protein
VAIVSKEQVRSLQEAGLALEREANTELGELREATLDATLSDGRTLRQALYDLTEQYEQRVEQLLWTKWGQRIRRSEHARLLSQFQAARARFMAYLSDFEDEQLDTKVPAANDESARDVATQAMEEERRTMPLVLEALMRAQSSPAAEIPSATERRPAAGTGEAGSTEEVRRLIAKIDMQRGEAMDLLISLRDDLMALPHTDRETDEEGPFTIRRLLHRITTHHQDHIQHLVRVRRNLGLPRSETARALAEAQAARAELISMLIGLTDEDIRKDVSEGHELGNLTPRSDSEPEYTIKRIVEHVVEMEEMRLGHIRSALEQAGR